MGRIFAAALLPLIALLILYLADVPIGQPEFLIYRYSPWIVLRLPVALLALFVGACGVFLLGRFLAEPRRRWHGLGAIAGYVFLVVWTFFAVPQPIVQHLFNMNSPSHDGAFFAEGQKVASIRQYLATDFYDRLANEPEQMRGRRVLSNPPGTTVATILVRRSLDACTGVRAWLIRVCGLTEVEDPGQRQVFAAMLVFAMSLTGAWGLSLIFAYRLCRLWLAPAAAATVALACVFNPATVNFTPGKDPAQLCSILAIMFCWMKGFVHRRWSYAAAAGAILAAAAMIGLIHIWVFGVLAVATLIHAVRERTVVRVWLLRCTLASLGGGAVVALLAYVALDWNIVRTAVAVGVRYGEIQLPIITDPFHWTLVGLPMFLLFVGPMFWIQLTAAKRDVRDETAVLAGRMLLVTIVAMTYTYFFANNSETPRLWMAMIPLLLIPMALRRSMFRVDTPVLRRLCLLLMVVQIGVTVLHWSMMDVRESEWRLLTQRYWD